MRNHVVGKDQGKPDNVFIKEVVDSSKIKFVPPQKGNDKGKFLVSHKVQFDFFDKNKKEE